MDGLRGLDHWLTTPPDDNSDAWEEYEDNFYERAQAAIFDHITQDLAMSRVGNQTLFRHGVLAAITLELDGEAIIEWARNIGAEIPSFDDWANPEPPEPEIEPNWG